MESKPSPSLESLPEQKFSPSQEWKTRLCPVKGRIFFLRILLIAFTFSKDFPPSSFSQNLIFVKEATWFPGLGQSLGDQGPGSRW